MLAIRSFTHQVGGRALLEGVSLGVEPGRLLAVIGPNGAGKSTLLRALSGDLAGPAALDGRPLAHWPLPALARRRAVLSQGERLEFPFTALEVAMLGRLPHGESAHDRAIALAALAEAGVESLAARPYPVLSGGERQRVQLARALAQIWAPVDGPRYLLLDEPTASLDPLHQHRVLALARRLARQGLGVLAVLHDLNLAAQYADRLAVLESGRLLAQGTPQQVLTPEIIDRAFGVAAMVVPHPCLSRPLVVLLPPDSEVHCPSPREANHELSDAC